VYQQAGLQRTADKCFEEALRIEPRNAIALGHYDVKDESGGFLGTVKRIFGGN
jgi:hypothetical protein